MNKAPKFFPVFTQDNSSLNHFPSWDEAINAYKARDYRKAILSTLRYINPQVAPKDGAMDKNTIEFRHGSVKGFLRLTNTHFELEVPFVRLPAPTPIAALRQVTEMNFNSLCLTQIILKGNVLVLHYKDALELAHPTKVYDLLREACRVADHYDDLFVEKYKASLLYSSQVTPLPNAIVEGAWMALQMMLGQTDQYIAHFEANRMFDLVFEPFYIFQHQALFVLNPQGYLRTQLTELGNSLAMRMQGGSSDLSEIKRNYEKIRKIQRAEFTKSMYSTDFLLSNKQLIGLDACKRYLEKNLSLAAADKARGSLEGATLCLLSGAYYYFAQTIGPPFVGQSLFSGLQSASDKNWQEASQTLLDAYNFALLSISTYEQLSKSMNSNQQQQKTGT